MIRRWLAGLALLGCQARTVGTVECAGAAECADGLTCNAAGECVPESDEHGFVLDDFEDGDNLPSDARFAVWQYYSYNPPNQEVFSTPDPDAAFNSNVGMRLQWRVVNEADGVPQYPGAGLRTEVTAAEAYVDLSAYNRVVLTHRYFRTEECRNIDRFVVALSCGELATWFEMLVPVSEEWKTESLRFSDFHQQMDRPAVDISITDCLALLDDFHIQADVGLPEGYCSAGTLHLDNLSFR